jgi:lipopolysaccharide transport system permease protein
LNCCCRVGVAPVAMPVRALPNKETSNKSLMHKSGNPHETSVLMKSKHWLVIEPNRVEKEYWKDVWRYRELFAILAWRDVAVRYKQTFIGVAWALIRPFLTMVVFTVVFGELAKLPSEGGAPYPVLVFGGMLPWQFFSTALSSCSDSLINNANLLTKVYFPRMIIPASAVISSCVDFLISFFILAGLMLWFHVWPSWRLLTLPLWMSIAFAASMGAGLWLASLNVQYRDFRYVVPFLVQIGLYVSPVGFSSTIIPTKWQLLYAMNPMVGVIEGFRWAIIGKSTMINPFGFWLSIGITAIVLATGTWHFRRVEKRIADVI